MKHRKSRDGKANNTPAPGRTDSAEATEQTTDSVPEPQTGQSEAWRTGHDIMPVNVSPVHQKPGRHRRY